MLESEPDFVICLDCETPCYTFEWHPDKERITEAFCKVCGNDRIDEFETEEEIEAMTEEE